MYDLSLLEWIEGGDQDLSAIDKTRAYVGKGKRNSLFTPCSY